MDLHKKLYSIWHIIRKEEVVPEINAVVAEFDRLMAERDEALDKLLKALDQNCQLQVEKADLQSWLDKIIKPFKDNKGLISHAMYLGQLGLNDDTNVIYAIKAFLDLQEKPTKELRIEPQQPAEGELVTPEEISKFTMSPDWPDVLRGEARDEAVAKVQLAHDKATMVKIDWLFQPCPHSEPMTLTQTTRHECDKCMEELLNTLKEKKK